MTTTNLPVEPEQKTITQSHSGILHHAWASLSATLILVVICCGIYPVVVWGIAQAVFPVQANGSLITKDGTYTTKDENAVGSSLLGQSFGAPQYFHPRPSAAGNGYDATSSGGTNLGPLSDKLLNGIHGSKNPDGTPNPSADFDGVKDLVAAYRKENGLSDSTLVPADAVTRSASGLDPHISPANAAFQVARVAKIRGMSVDAVKKLVTQFTDLPSFGVLGDPGVNVLRLNLALDTAAPMPATAPATSPATVPATAPVAPTTETAPAKSSMQSFPSGWHDSVLGGRPVIVTYPVLGTPSGWHNGVVCGQVPVASFAKAGTWSGWHNGPVRLQDLMEMEVAVAGAGGQTRREGNEVQVP